MTEVQLPLFSVVLGSIVLGFLAGMLVNTLFNKDATERLKRIERLIFRVFRETIVKPTQKLDKEDPDIDIPTLTEKVDLTNPNNG